MNYCCKAIALLFVFVFSATSIVAEDWPQWRGPKSNNHASPDTDAPLRWSFDSARDFAWKTKIPGRGHSTPIVVGDAIYLTTADEKAGTQSTLKLNRRDGKLLDVWENHRGTLPAQVHPHNSHASPSPAWDGSRLFVSFHTDDAIWLTAMSPEGRPLWKKKVSDFAPERFQFGYGASPIIESGLVIVAAEYDGNSSGVYAFDVRSGREMWKITRPKNLNFATPIVATLSGRRQLLLAGAEMICSYDPHTGKELWRVDTTTEAICGTIVWDDRRVLISGGNPASGTWCIDGDGSRNLLWENPVKCYEQSLLTVPNQVFGVADTGVAYCWRTADGRENWKKRLFGGGISASPLLVRDRLYIASEAGTIYVVAATPDRFDLLAENQTGDSIFASPIAVDNRLIVRTAVREGNDRQEYLIAIGE